MIQHDAFSHVLDVLIGLAQAADFGAHGDITTACTELTGVGDAVVEARADGVFAGEQVLPQFLDRVAPEVSLNKASVICDGQSFCCGQVLARLKGRVDHILAIERMMLNFLQRLCGVATLTHRFVAAVAGTGTRIYDTRKTLPGWHCLDRYAVRCGGGGNHRFGLHDAILVKDNHLAGVALNDLQTFVHGVVMRAHRLHSKPRFICVEVDALAMLEHVLRVDGVDIILLDNFTPEGVLQAVQMRNNAGRKGQVELEASGGITMDVVRSMAEAGVERISIGAITHSAPAVNMSLTLRQAT